METKNESRNTSNSNSILEAIEKNNQDLVIKLLDQGVNPGTSLYHEDSDDFYTALEFAFIKEQRECLAIILDYVNLNSVLYDDKFLCKVKDIQNVLLGERESPLWDENKNQTLQKVQDFLQNYSQYYNDSDSESEDDRFFPPEILLQLPVQGYSILRESSMDIENSNNTGPNPDANNSNESDSSPSKGFSNS